MVDDVSAQASGRVGWRLSEDKLHVEQRWIDQWQRAPLGDVVKALREYDFDRDRTWARNRDLEAALERVQAERDYQKNGNEIATEQWLEWRTLADEQTEQLTALRAELQQAWAELARPTDDELVIRLKGVEQELQQAQRDLDTSQMVLRERVDYIHGFEEEAAKELQQAREDLVEEERRNRVLRAQMTAYQETKFAAILQAEQAEAECDDLKNGQACLDEACGCVFIVGKVLPELCPGCNEGFEPVFLTDKLMQAEAALTEAQHSHGWIPDLLIDHDAPVCEVCHGTMDKHEGEALITSEYFRLKGQLTEALGKAALADELRMLDEFVEAVEYDNEGCAQGACIFFASRYDTLTAPATEATTTPRKPARNHGWVDKALATEANDGN